MTDDTTDEQRDGQAEQQTLSDRLLDLFLFLPTGVVVTVAEELPRLAERGRERLGVHVNSARAVGEFAVTAGGQELKKRSSSRGRPAAARTGTGAAGGSARPAPDGAHTTRTGTTRLRTIPYPEDRQPPSAPPPTASPTPSPTAPVDPAAATAPPVAPAAPATAATVPPIAAPAPATTAAVPAPASPTAARAPVDAHVPDVASLAIPGFDTLSASQVVQRLDGLSRTELVAVRAYETSGRGRRTILSRVDQLLDERS
jgi:hypothetical protein